MKFREFILDVKKKINDLSTDHKVYDVTDKKDKPKYRYYSFIILACAIEMMGGALDDNPWHCSGLSEKRFNKALNEYESLKKYSQYNLYILWRCGMAHVLVPNSGIGLCIEIEGCRHLDKEKGVVSIVLEKIVEDFNLACDELIDNIDGRKNNLSLGVKSYGEHLTVPQDLI